MEQNRAVTVTGLAADTHATTMRLVPRLTRLFELRQRAAMSQADLAVQSGVARTTIIRLEHGEPNPKPSTLRKLAKALRVRPPELWEER